METHAPLKARGEKFARSAGFEWLSRAGFAARGIVYMIIGILAIKVALGRGGTSANQQGALRAVAQQPFGNVLLILVAIGLGGYALWRFVRGLLGHGPEGADSGMDRIAALASGIVYTGLCAIAIEILLGCGARSAGAQKTTAGVFGWPAGIWLVAIAGACSSASASPRLPRNQQGLPQGLEDGRDEPPRPPLDPVDRDPRAPGSNGRLLPGWSLPDQRRPRLQPQPGRRSRRGLSQDRSCLLRPLLLGLVTAGLIAFGIYSLSDARYRRI